jgi:molybdopterin-binding protein
MVSPSALLRSDLPVLSHAGNAPSAAKALSMKISARNQIPGKITAVRTGSIMAEVEVAIDPAHITAAITRGSVDQLALKEGDDVIVVIKSTEVMVGKE